jgi:peptidoglycan/LPS O-acetylase OafA/YrhL
MNTNEIKSLTSIRYFIAIYVFLFHIQIRWQIIHRAFPSNILFQGAVGMTFFFMLSGFILALNYEKLEVKRYFISRFSRIYPIYLFSALVTLPWIGISASNSWSHGLNSKILISAFVVLLNLFIIQAWFPPLFQLWNDGGSWSISAESFFYLCFPMMQNTLNKIGKKSAIVFFASYIAMNLIGLGICLFPNTSMGIAYSVPIYRLGEFICGVALLHILKNFELRFFRNFHNLILFGLSTLLIFNLGFLGAKWPTYIMQDWIAIPFFAGLLLYLYLGFGFLSRFLSLRLFVLLGKSSYCFYSIEVLFLIFSDHNHGFLVNHWSLLSDNRVLCLFLFMLTQASALLLYFLVEKPARTWINRFAASR